MTSRRSRRKRSTGHGLLAGKVVVVTAAAGTGIGSADGAAGAGGGRRRRRLRLPRAPAGRDPRRAGGTGAGPGRRGGLRRHVDRAGRRADRRHGREIGRLDVLVNNAGLGGQTPVVDMTDEEWDRVLNVTLTR